ncbi:MAG: DUF86 domain-containing protein [Prochlorothrix sp.]
MNPRDRASLQDMLKAADRASSFTAKMSYASFEADIQAQSAVLYQIIIIGEAVKRLSPDFRSQHPEVSWSAIAGMRDKLVHDYDGVEVERVWSTLQTNIPALIGQLQTILAE